MQPINASSPFMSLPKDGIVQVPVAKQKEQLEKQVEEFASVLYTQMFSEMREAGKSGTDEEEGGGVFGGGDTDNFMHLMDEKLAKSFVAQGGNTLKDSLFKQLAGRIDEQAQAKGGGK